MTFTLGVICGIGTVILTLLTLAKMNQGFAKLNLSLPNSALWITAAVTAASAFFGLRGL
jgi:hypothetical protein